MLYLSLTLVIDDGMEPLMCSEHVMDMIFFGRSSSLPLNHTSREAWLAKDSTVFLAI